MAIAQRIDKHVHELLWANAEAAKGSYADLWYQFKSTNRVHGSVGSRFVLWQATPDGPAILQTFAIEDIGAEPASGVWFDMRGAWGAFQITHTPTLLPGSSVFAWVPFFTDLRWVPSDFLDLNGPRRLTAPICIKTATNPLTDLAEGDHYLTARSDLLKRFPNLKG
jgi:hypothetical protein